MIKDKIKQNVSETFKLLWQFKWSISVYLIFYCALIREYLNPPAKDSLIWGSEAMEGSWNYINQEVYVGSMWDTLIIFMLFFFIGTSNMRNHPTLAKIIFLFPLISLLLGIIISVVKEI